MRGILKSVDPVYDQLIVHTFGGGDLHIKFDARTEVIPGSSQLRMTSIPVGSVLSIDTVTENGKLFARSVRTSTASFAELNGQVVGFDATRAELTLRDPVSPEDVTLKVIPTTSIVRQGHSAHAQSLTPGTLVLAWVSPVQKTLTRVEILATPGDGFTFAGRIIAVNLPSHVLSLSNESDQTLRELHFDTLDGSQLGLLHEGASVVIQAQFDGDHYDIRTIAAMPQAQQP